MNHCPKHNTRFLLFCVSCEMERIIQIGNLLGNAQPPIIADDLNEDPAESARRMAHFNSYMAKHPELKPCTTSIIFIGGSLDGHVLSAKHVWGTLVERASPLPDGKKLVTIQGTDYVIAGNLATVHHDDKPEVEALIKSIEGVR